MSEQHIGFVTHYFNHLGVAAIKLTEGDLAVGDTVHVKGHTSDFITQVKSMQSEHETINRAGPGADVGILVPLHAHEHDRVYKVA
jgi:hypothetical protein